MNDDRQGCFSGLLQLFLVKQVYDWFQKKFGYGNGCFGCGCGCIFVVIFVIIVIGILFKTDFLRFWF
ncbi:hypothetical protein [Flexilinea flocculi]|jgi:hypothetical protein|uniref:Uncharacterized protein n=1 Tax=Flexilinea flocculi TaxID=1678840 RepID=A0A0S7BUG9_9CHLR|nr:hypothetical protein [Flexilinea flocculi]NMB94175.1 hypothetical protein [Flexilinea flocculi]GAP40441.1 hypothetical protein ATC1_13417 [Flexilinea flocculi]